MELNHYKQYLHFKTIGLRFEAKQSIQQYVTSFTSIAEKEQWTHQFLEAEEYKYGYNKIRHEIYEEVVFPALLSGYLKHEPWSILWLARTAQNFYKLKHLHEQIDFKTDYGLLKDCYLLDPSNTEVCKDLLTIQIQWFQYCIHEYPYAIIYGCDGATIDECQKIYSEIELAREIDIEKTQKDFLNEVQSKMLEYLNRLQKHQISQNLYEQSSSSDT